MKGGDVDVSWKGGEASFPSCSCLYVLTYIHLLSGMVPLKPWPLPTFVVLCI